jgi:riboflavin biosynthesis pyrimidine reductase
MTGYPPVSEMETLFAQEAGEPLPLSGELARIFGFLRLPLQRTSAYVVGNFVTTLDGVVALNTAGHMSGADISGFNRQDQALVGLLRAVADAVIVGAGTMRVEEGHLLTPEDIAPDLETDYRVLREKLGKTEAAWNVIVSAHGRLNLEQPVFRAGQVPILVVTTARGLANLRTQTWGPSTRVVAVQDEGAISASALLRTIGEVCRGRLWLLEGGPRLLGDFLQERLLDELFLTLAPQIAGRADAPERPGLVADKLFAPSTPRWSQLTAVRRSESHLFLRYALKEPDAER